MKKFEAIDQAIRIATLQEPTDTMTDLLYPLEFSRVLELLLILRQSPRPVKAPAAFLRRAIEEGWTPETLPEKVDRRTENRNEQFYIGRGYTPEQARAKVHGQRNKEVWEAYDQA